MNQKKRRHGGGFNTFTSCLSITMVLILLGGMILFIMMGENLSRNLREEMPVAVLLNDSITQDELGKLQYDIREMPGVQSLVYISKEQGAMETMQAMGIEQDDFLEYNPIGAELELRLRADYMNRDSIAELDALIRSHRNVTDIISPMAEIDLINHIIPIVSTVFLGIAILLAFISVALINNTMRMSIYAHRFTIHTMKLVGAKWSFIRRPFMAKALRMGATSSLLAATFVGIGIYVILLLDVYITTLLTAKVILTAIGSILLGGILLTLLCAYLSVNRFLRLKTDQLFLK